MCASQRGRAGARAIWSTMTVVRAVRRAATTPSRTTEVARLPRGADAMRCTRAPARSPRCARSSPQREFVEVETPLLVPSPGLEIHLDAVDGRRRLSDHVARVPDEAPARGRLRADLPGLQVLPRRRARPAPRERVHDGRVVPRLRGARRDRRATPRSWSPTSCARSPGAWSRASATRTIDVTPPWPRMTVREAMRDYAGDRARR